MRRPGGVRRRSHLGVFIAVAAITISICAAAPTAAAPALPAQTSGLGAISGTVTDASGAPLAGVSVQAFSGTLGGGSTTTAADGTYTISNLNPADYSVAFSDPGYVTQYWNNVLDPHVATQVTVSSGQTTTGIDAHLQLGATVTGTVTGADGKPLSSVSVVSNAMDCSFNGTCPFATTTANGTYTLTGLDPGFSPWTIEFSHVGDVTQTAGPYTLTAGQTTTVNVQLQASPPNSATLTGSVYGPGFTPLDGTKVIVHNYFGFTVAQTTTSGGLPWWTVSNLGAGVYRVEYQPPAGSNALGQWYNNEPDGAHSDTVGLVNGQTVDLPQVFLSAAGSISGTVTDTTGPVAGATVGIFAVNSSNAPGVEAAHTTTAADGTYSVSGLQVGNYHVLFDAPAGSTDVGQWFNNSSTAGDATAITFAAGGTATADAQLTAAQRGSIAGTVTDASGNPIAGATVLAAAADGTAAATASTAADGTYTINNLDVGIDTVWFLPPAGSTYGPSVWNLAVGKVVRLTIDQGTAITGINATLPQNGT